VARIFGTDGVRGLANADLTPELALAVGEGLVRTLREEGVRRPAIVVGRDPRWSGEMIRAALVAGITSAGGDAVDVGVLPTPAVAYLTQTSGAAAGVMISASHNPVQDNGIKCFGPDGHKLTDAEEDRLQELIDDDFTDRPTGLEVGRHHHDRDGLQRYIAHVVASSNADLTGMKLVVDAANGAASVAGPEVYRRLGAEVIAIHADPDGANINDNCGSNHPEVLLAAVAAHGADAGVSHDGDADRLVAAAADATEVDGDVILAILARNAHEAGTLVGDTVVTTVMTNLGFKHAMANLGIDVVETKVGDRYVLEAMRDQGFTLGGEQSGHVIQLEHATTGDGVLTAARLLGVVTSTGQSLAELAKVMTRLPQVLLNVRGVRKDDLDGNAAIWDAVSAAEAELADNGRVLVRASGTEPMVRVMVEATTQGAAQAHADTIAEIVAASLS
jgi:phosphoglucosamine mutase